MPNWLVPQNYNYISSLPESKPTSMLKELQVRRTLYHIAKQNPDELRGNSHWLSIMTTGRRSMKKRYRAKVMTKYAKKHDETNLSPPRTVRKRRNTYPKLELSIDPSAPNKLLMVEIKHLLQQHRKAHKVHLKKPLFKPSHVAKIKDNKIIPFIDLMIWQRVNNISITSDLFAETFLPERTSNFIDKRVRTLAESILRPGYLEEFDLSINKNAKK